MTVDPAVTAFPAAPVEASGEPDDVVDVAIIGGGPAGLAAGLYASRALRRTVLWEREMIGGQIAAAGAIENYPGFPEGIDGFDLASAMHAQAERFGLATRYEPVTGIRRERPYYVLETPSGDVRAKTVIFTAGASPNRLGVPGEMEFVGKGVSYCATCDAAFFNDQVVAVVGGGDAALDEALFTTRYASKTYLIHRRERLRASAVLQKRAFEEEKIEILWNTVVERINGNHADDGVKALLLRNVESGETSELPISAVFIFIGQTPNSDVLGRLVPLDGGGHAYVNLWMETEQPGLFVAGDVRVDAARQVASAAGDGVTAAIRAEHYLSRRFGSPASMPSAASVRPKNEAGDA